MKKVVCFVLLFAGLVVGKPLGGIAVEVDSCVEEYESHQLNDSLIPLLGNIFSVHPNSKKLGIIANVHAHTNLEKTEIKYHAFTTETGDDVSIPYKVSGIHQVSFDQAMNMTSVCVLDIVFEKKTDAGKIQFQVNQSNRDLFNDEELSIAAQDEVYEKLLEDSIEVCVVGFYGNLFNQNFTTYVELIEYIKDLTRQELKKEHPTWTPQEIEEELDRIFEGIQADNIEEFIS